MVSEPTHLSRRGFVGGIGIAAGAVTSAPVRAVPNVSPYGKVRIILLGTGSPSPSLRRQSSGYLLQVGDDVILLDHGTGAGHRLLEAGYKAIDVTHLFLSHLHYDHMMDYPRLLMQRWDQAAGNRPELKVFGPSPIARVTQAIIGPDGIFGPDIHARVNFQASKDVFAARGGTLPRKRPAPEVREVAQGDVIEGRGWRMTVGEASHHQPFLKCQTYRLDTPDGSLTYSGDSGGVPEGLVALAQGSDLLIHMCHFPSGLEPTPEFRRSTGSHMDIAEIAKRAKVGALVLSHMTPLLDRPGVKERMMSEISRVYTGPVVFGEDLMEIPFRIAYPQHID